MANAGRAELDIVAVGKDQVSAMLRQIDSQLKATKTQMDGVAGAANKAGGGIDGLGSQMEALKAKAGGVNKIREVFENLRGNALFAVGGFIALVEAVQALSDAFSHNKELLKQWDDAQKKLGSQLQASASAVERIRLLLGGLPVDDYTQASEDAMKAWQDINDSISKGTTALAIYQREYDAVVATSITNLGALAEMAELEKTIRLATSDLNKAKEEANRLQAEANRLTEAQAKTLQRMLDLDVPGRLARGALAGAAGAAPLNPFAAIGLRGAGGALTGSQAPRPRRGGGGIGAPRDLSTDTDVSAAMQGDVLGGLSGLAINLQVIEDWRERMAARWAQTVDFGIMADGVRSVTSEVDKLISALDQAANAAFPEFGASLGELQGISAGYAAQVAALNEQVVAGTLDVAVAEEKAAQARMQGLIAGTTAIAAGLAKMLGGLRAEYVVRSAGEFAAGVATSVTNPAEAATHFLASGLYAAAAAQAGGGGGGGRAASGSGGSNPRTARVAESTGPTTIVNNFSSLLVDRQQVSRALSEVDARGQRSGYQRRRGA